MVEISEINGTNSLEMWLRNLPFDEAEKRRISVIIAHRAAMRVLPVYWHWAITENIDISNLPDPLSVLRISLLTCVESSAPTALIREMSQAVYNLPDTTSDGVEIPTNAIKAKEAASNAAHAAHEADHAFAAAQVAVENSADVDGQAANLLWDNVLKDCAALENGAIPFDKTPLWSGENPFSDIWETVQQSLPDGDEFWRDWYQNVLGGVKPNWDMLTKIATDESIDWDKGPDHVNGLIAEIQLDFAVSATPNAEEIVVDETDKYQAIPRSDLPAQTLSDVQDRLREVIAQIRRAQQQENNQYAPLVDEADLLEHTLAKYSENALRIFEACSKVTGHIGNHVTHGVLPENDNLIGDVISDVQNSADDIYSFDAEVKTAVDARNQRRYERLSDDQKANIALLAEAIAQNSAENFADELREDKAAVQNEGEPSEETTISRYRLGSRMVKIVAIGGTVLVAVTTSLSQAEGAVVGAQYLWSIIRPLIGL